MAASAPADSAQGHRRGGRDIGIGILEFASQFADRFGVTANSDRVDGADQEPALQLGNGRSQRGIGCRAGDGFKGDTRPGR